MNTHAQLLEARAVLTALFITRTIEGFVVPLREHRCPNPLCPVTRARKLLEMEMPESPWGRGLNEEEARQVLAQVEDLKGQIFALRDAATATTTPSPALATSDSATPSNVVQATPEPKSGTDTPTPPPTEAPSGTAASPVDKSDTADKPSTAAATPAAPPKAAAKAKASSKASRASHAKPIDGLPNGQSEATAGSAKPEIQKL